MTARQILDVALAAGFTGNDAVTAVAIALAESGGNPNALNPDFFRLGDPIPAKLQGLYGPVCKSAYCGDYSLGLWQINMRPDMRALRISLWGLNRMEDLYTPAVNARVAFALYRGRGGKFTDWTTYNGGKGVFLNHMPSARTAYALWAAEQTAPPVVAPPAPPSAPPDVPVSVNPPAPPPVKPAADGAASLPTPNPGSSAAPSFLRSILSWIDAWLKQRGL